MHMKVASHRTVKWSGAEGVVLDMQRAGGWVK